LAMKEKTRKKEQRKRKKKKMEDIQAKETSEDAFDDTSDKDEDDGSYCDNYKIRNWASDDSDKDYGEVIEW
jgi:hypothetical protein